MKENFLILYASRYIYQMGVASIEISHTMDTKFSYVVIMKIKSQ